MCASGVQGTPRARIHLVVTVVSVTAGVQGTPRARTHLVVTVVSVTLDTALTGHDASPRRSIFTYFVTVYIYESLRESFFSDLALPR